MPRRPCWSWGSSYRFRMITLTSLGTRVTGKIGTDIQDGKWSWLVVQCLQRASPEQCQILQENYGEGG